MLPYGNVFDSSRELARGSIRARGKLTAMTCYVKRLN